MEKNKTRRDESGVSRRDFIKTSAAVSLSAMLAHSGNVFAEGSDRIRVGLIGCGGRGSGAAKDCLESADGVELIGMGDLFKDRLDDAFKRLKGRFPDRVKVTPDTSFVGFDAYEKVIASDVNMVILATPPGFRPMHLKAAIEAGKHVFMEKPLAVDPVGVRSILASSELAKKKGLGIVAGTQRRHQAHYVEIMRRIHSGALGDITSAQCYWNQGGMGDYWKYYERDSLSDMEWQCRNWSVFTWLSGDHIVEQHVHNLDIINWALGAHPIKALGMGGRQVRVGPRAGNIYDHFAVELEYPNGVRVLSMCRQIPGCTGQVAERVIGTKGLSYTNSEMGRIEGANAFVYGGPNPNPYVVEHADLIRSIRKGEPLNEGKNVAEGTLAAVLGRMSTYTGKELTWDWAMNESKLDLSPPKYEFGDLPAAPVAVPGETRPI
jgi:predicted dehydrogenase